MRTLPITASGERGQALATPVDLSRRAVTGARLNERMVVVEGRLTAAAPVLEPVS